MNNRQELDGHPFPGVMAYTYCEHQADFVQAGLEVFRLSLPVGWVGPDRYDYTEADEVAAAFCAAHPKVRLFPLLWLDGPETKWWELENPGELAVARDRQTGAIRCEHPAVPGYAQPGQDFTPKGDLFDRHHQGTPCLHSFASTLWRTQAAEALGRAIAHYEKTFPGRFAGYYVCAGLSYEWFNWGNYTDDVLFDYSAPMRTYFQSWLERRYGTPDALSAAWHRPVSRFEEVEPPPPSERPAHDAFALLEGQEQSWVDLFGGAFRNPAMREALARLQELAVSQLALRCAPRAEALVVVDEESLRWTTPNHPLTVPLFAVQKQWHLLRSGFPWTFITLEDYLKLDWPDAKLVYFVNLFRQRAGLADRLHARLRAQQATAVWTLWPGWLGEAGLDVDGVTELTGFSVEALSQTVGDWSFRSGEGLLYGTGVHRAEYEARMKYYPPAHAFAGQPRLGIQPEPGDEVLAEWTDCEAVSLARSRHLGFASVLNAGPLLPEQILHALAGPAGVHRYTAPGHLVYANGKAVAVYTGGAAGSCTVQLRQPARVIDLWSKKPVASEPVSQVTVPTVGQETLLWRLDA